VSSNLTASAFEPGSFLALVPKNMKYAYHASKNQGLKTIEPRTSTHGVSWVYAMEKPEYCMMFLGNSSDIIIQTGFTDGLPYLAERFLGALEYAYKDKEGSIYTLDGVDFKTGMTTFNHELVCDHACEVLEERKIEDALTEILQLESEGKLKIYRHLHLPPWMPADKSDLVEKVVEWTKNSGGAIPEAIKEFHPDILDEITKRLSE
jgi:hypothetical protein